MTVNRPTGNRLHLVFFILLGILIVIGLSGIFDMIDGRPFASGFVESLKHPSPWQILLSGAGVVLAGIAIFKAYR